VIAAERLRMIREWLLQEHVVSTSTLSRRLGVSEMTVRRDLRQLEQMHLCHRTHGGAVAVHGLSVQDMPYNQREALNVAEKVAIGRAAAALVLDGETIAIDSGTTAAHMAAALRNRQSITVVTNSLLVLNHLFDAQGITVICTGGILSSALNQQPGRDDPCLVGPLAEATIRRFRPSKAFMATTGLTIADGLTNGVLSQAEVKRAMIEVSSEVILLADHTKFGQVASSVVGPVTLVHRVITDQGISPQMCLALQELGIEVTVVATGELGEA
jgi:DeoR family fructose operon transcriptional repressor